MEEVRVRVGDAAPATTKSGLALALEMEAAAYHLSEVPAPVLTAAEP